MVIFVGTPSSSPPPGITSLYVLDAATGLLRYTVTLPEGYLAVMPTIFQDPITAATTAFVTDGSLVSAVSLGPVSGSVLWTQSGLFGGQSMPTVVGNSIILASPFQYYAFDRTTGAPNHFYATGGSGGGGTTVAYDAARGQFYVNEVYSDATPTLSAYHYIDNDHDFALCGNGTGAVLVRDSQVAIGPDGKVYSAGNIVIWESRSDHTGSTLRTIPGHFANGSDALLSNGVMWTFSDQAQRRNRANIRL